MNTRLTLRNMATFGGVLLLGLIELIALARSRRSFPQAGVAPLGSRH